MTRYRWLVLALLVVAVSFAIAAPVLISSFNQRLANRTTLAVTCVSAVANIEQLTALAEIADQLGVPHDFIVPKVPVECADF